MERKISLLQEFVAVSRYARWLDDEGRRENWGDTVLRYVDFMNRHTEGQFESVLYRQVLPAIEDHAVMPSMRALMTAGPALEREGLAAFNCFHGDTKYMTINGLRTFAETVGTVQKVLSGDGIWRDAVVRCYGRQPLNRVTLRPGARSRTSVRLEFLVTPDHRWITQAGVVTDLKLGDTVPFNAVVPPEFNAEDFIRGFGFGDGTIDNRGRARIRLCGDKAKYLGVFQSYGHLSEMYPPSYDHDPCLVFHAGHFSDWKELPEVPTYWWLAGYIAADGASGDVTPNISTQNPKAADYLLQNLPYGGYAVVGHTEYSGPTNYGPRSNPLQKIGIRDEIDFKVVAIENLFASEEVYCVEEPVTQSFTLEGGVLTGNCAFVAINHKRKFAEALYILMCGTGVGFSCERQEIQHLPTVPLNLQPCDDIITVGDSKDGWAKAYRKLVSCLYDGDIPNLDYSNVRPAGARLKIFGGRASGPKVFRRLCEYTVSLFKKAKGRKLNSLEVHDLMCTIGEIVVVGGVRRSALISLSNLSDLRMREAKTGQWYTENPQRALANNSVAYTEMPNVEIFMEEWLSLIRSKSGERGIFNREAAQRQAAKHGRRPADYPYSTNPCGEILLRDRGLCNLTEVVIRSDDTLESLTHKVSIATILGTLQSTITNFGFVDEEWKKNAEMERLLGVSLTGIYDHPIMSGKKGKDTLIRWLKELHEVAWKVNQEWSEIMGIAPSAAITAVKPSGTVSQLVDSASGIHPRHSAYYLRTVRLDKKDPMCAFMSAAGVYSEDALGREDTTAVFYFPVKSPEGAVLRDDINALEHLALWSIYHEHWCDHNPSITITVRDHEWFSVGAWVYENFDKICGISFLPHSDHVYQQAPYIEVTKEQYDDWVAQHPVPDVDWALLSGYEKEDNTVSSQTLACQGGVCDLI